MSDATRRALRTLFQWIIAGGLTALAGALFDAESEVIALIHAFNMLCVTFAQNWLEDNTQFPAMLKAQASSGNNPLTVSGEGGDGQAGHGNVNVLWVIAVILGAIFLLLLLGAR